MTKSIVGKYQLKKQKHHLKVFSLGSFQLNNYAVIVLR